MTLSRLKYILALLYLWASILLIIYLIVSSDFDIIGYGSSEPTCYWGTVDCGDYYG